MDTKTLIKKKVPITLTDLINLNPAYQAKYGLIEKDIDLANFFFTEFKKRSADHFPKAGDLIQHRVGNKLVNLGYIDSVKDGNVTFIKTDFYPAVFTNQKKQLIFSFIGDPVNRNVGELEYCNTQSKTFWFFGFASGWKSQGAVYFEIPINVFVIKN